MSVALVPENETFDILESGPLSSTILQRIAAGDTAAVDECLEKYGGLVWSLAKQLTRTQDDAEDATQEVFVELWQKASSFAPDKSSESTFIAMVARRRLIDRLRRDERRPMTASVSSDSIDLSEAVRALGEPDSKKGDENDTERSSGSVSRKGRQSRRFWRWGCSWQRR